MQDEILAVVEASAPRRWMGVLILSVVGFLVFFVAISQPPALGWQVFLILVGALSLWLAQRLYLATSHRIELTETELRASSGEVIALVSEIEGIDRGAFAFKPSSGFLIRTKNPGLRAWHPGLWWRVGRRVGVGGVTPGAQTKFMSEALSAMIAERI